MPPPPGRSGDICIWVISIVLFVSILSGGTLLVLYITLPESETTVWFPAAGMILVGIPWLFWIITCFYRSMTLRGNVGERSPVMAPAAPAAGGATAMSVDAVDDSPVASPAGNGKKKVHFGVATVDSKQEADAGGVGGGGKLQEGEGDGGSHAASNASHNDGSSLGSRGSETPLALSMK